MFFSRSFGLGVDPLLLVIVISIVVLIEAKLAFFRSPKPHLLFPCRAYFKFAAEFGKNVGYSRPGHRFFSTESIFSLIALLPNHNNPPSPPMPSLPPSTTTSTTTSSRSISAGHDRSDGGIATTLLEMAFAGEIGCGLEVDLPYPCSAADKKDKKEGSSSSSSSSSIALDVLFNEEVKNEKS